MGYWEQIGVENQRHRERLERTPPIRRKIKAAIVTAGVIMAALFLWAVALAPLVMPFL